MTHPPTPDPKVDPVQRICEILTHLRDAIQQSVNEIERISALEVQRHGDDTVEGVAWCDFGDGLHSDVTRAARCMEWQIAAMRGALIYRGLEQRPQGDTPSTPQRV